MKKLLIKFIAVVYLFVVSIPLTILVYLLYYIISIILYFKKTKKNEKRVSTIPSE
jgi:ABC-type microcin C transport system permease subunit YejB